MLQLSRTLFLMFKSLCILSVEEISSYLLCCRSVNHINAHIITMCSDSLHQQSISEELQGWIIDGISHSWQTFIWNAVIQNLPLFSLKINPNVNYSIQQIKNICPSSQFMISFLSFDGSRKDCLSFMWNAGIKISCSWKLEVLVTESVWLFWPPLNTHYFLYWINKQSHSVMTKQARIFPYCFDRCCPGLITKTCIPSKIFTAAIFHTVSELHVE